MKITDIYEKYKIMPNLQEHQLRVAGVASIICDNFQKEINKEEVITACLLHDMGNMARKSFKFYPDSLGEKSEKYWQEVRKEFIEKYGNNEHDATFSIAKEIGADKKVGSWVKLFGFPNAEEILKSDNFNLKIASYSDHRVSPDGVVSMEERHEDAKQRHVIKTPRFEEKFFEQKRVAWRKIEKQIFENAKISPDFITDEKVNKEIKKLKNFEI